MIQSILVILSAIGLVSCGQYNLNMRLNNYVSTATCKDAECNTFFRFCIKQSGSDECVAEFETQVIGASSISGDQFKLTTNTIELKFASQHDSILVIQVLSNKLHRELISEWSVSIETTHLGQWKQFDLDYSLECGHHFSGLNCEVAVCSTGCKNGGVCVIEAEKPVCKCNRLYSKGDLCEIKIVHACNTKCLNGGSCLGDGACLCAPGYSGARCQIKRYSSQCGQVTCYNGGTCMIDNQNEYVCACHPAFTGPLCDTRIQQTTTTTTTPAPTTTTSQIATETIIPATESTQLPRSMGYSLQEIILIVTLGCGMPVFTILSVLILCRLSASRKTISESKAEEVNKKVDNFYTVSAEVMKKSDSFIQNNLFNAADSAEKKVCTKTIQMTNSYTQNELSRKSEFNLIENNIYSIVNYPHGIVDAKENEVNCKNLNRNYFLNEVANSKFYSNEANAFIATIV